MTPMRQKGKRQILLDPNTTMKGTCKDLNFAAESDKLKGLIFSCYWYKSYDKLLLITSNTYHLEILTNRPKIVPEWRHT